MEKRIKAALALSILSPVFGELISGSSPPLEFFNPLAFIFLWGLYGGGVLIMRELWVRWGAGYMRLMIIGMTYGIIEEGLAIKSFFDPNWMDLGILGTYGRIAGTNLVWAVWLSIFHAIYSITIPILLIGILYPEFRGKRLLTDKGRKKVLAVFLLTCALIFGLLNPYAPPPVQYILTLLVVAAFLKLSSEKEVWNPSIRLPLERHPFLWGTAFAFYMMFMFTILPKSGMPFWVPCILGVLMTLVFYGSLDRLSEKRILALIMGLMTFLMLIGIVLELNGVIGAAAAGLLMYVLLFRIYRKLPDTP